MICFSLTVQDDDKLYTCHYEFLFFGNEVIFCRVMKGIASFRCASFAMAVLFFVVVHPDLSRACLCYDISTIHFMIVIPDFIKILNYFVLYN